jgi:peptidoglycan/xylan/chitin deacetylase (PgdA/CDA1 family)
MLLKRFIVLAAGVLLFIAAFIIYFDYSHKKMEDRFQAERQKFGVEGLVLTSSTPPVAPEPAPAATADSNTLIGPVPPPAGATPDNSTAPAAPASPESATSPVAPASPDGTMAPAAPASPDSTPAIPAAPDTNAAPANPPSSTMDSPRGNRSSFFQFASYRPDASAEVRLAQALPGAEVESVAPATTNTFVPASGAVPTLAVPSPATGPANQTPGAAPAPSSASRTAASEEGSVIVLLFHQFKAAGVPIPAKYQWTMNQDVFISEMKYIHDNGYNVISMDQLLKFIKHEGTVPPRAVCITIDDGYKSAIVYAAPILKQYGYPWTFFIYPDFVTVAEGSGAVSWNDLLELQKEGIDIECHSMTHPNLKLHKQKVKGVWHDFTPEEYAAWLNNETAGAKAILEQHMGKAITCFAYPYGEYNKQVEDAVIAAGFEAIFTVADNPVHETTSLHSIGRYTITQGVEKNFAAYLRQGALGLSDADPAPGATVSNPRPIISATLGYPGTLDPKSIETSVRDFGDVRHDFDPTTNTIRLYLPRDLIAPVVLVNIRVRDAATQQIMVANWHFNYEPAGAVPNATHAPIASPASASTPATPTPTPATNTPAVSTPDPLEKSATGTPLDAHSTTTPPKPVD